MNCLFTTRSQYFGHEEQFIFVKFYAEGVLGITDYFYALNIKRSVKFYIDRAKIKIRTF